MTQHFQDHSESLEAVENDLFESLVRDINKRHILQVINAIQTCRKNQPLLGRMLLRRSIKMKRNLLTLAASGEQGEFLPLLLNTFPDNECLSNALESKDIFMLTPLAMATLRCCEKNVKLLLFHIKDLKKSFIFLETDILGRTPLTIAVSNCQATIAQLLLDACDDEDCLAKMLQTKDKSGYTPLEHAIANNRCDLLQILVSACYRAKCLKEVLHATGKWGRTLLATAAFKGDKDCTVYLVKICRDAKLLDSVLKVSDKFGLTPVAGVVYQKHKYLYETFITGNNAPPQQNEPVNTEQFSPSVRCAYREIVPLYPRKETELGLKKQFRTL